MTLLKERRVTALQAPSNILAVILSQSLIKIAARLQEDKGKRVDFEAIQYLMSSSSEKRPDLLDKVFGSVPKLKVQDLYKERNLDELRAKRKYRV
jgi:hypothetical protein